MIGAIAARIERIGIFASPEAPIATSVKNGPSFNESNAIAPQSTSSP